MGVVEGRGGYLGCVSGSKFPVAFSDVSRNLVSCPLILYIRSIASLNHLALVHIRNWLVSIK